MAAMLDSQWVVAKELLSVDRLVVYLVTPKAPCLAVTKAALMVPLKAGLLVESKVGYLVVQRVAGSVGMKVFQKAQQLDYYLVENSVDLLVVHLAKK